MTLVGVTHAGENYMKETVSCVILTKEITENLAIIRANRIPTWDIAFILDNGQLDVLEETDNGLW